MNTILTNSPPGESMSELSSFVLKNGRFAGWRNAVIKQKMHFNKVSI